MLATLTIDQLGAADPTPGTTTTAPPADLGALRDHGPVHRRSIRRHGPVRRRSARRHPERPVSVLAGPFAIAAALLAVGGALKAVRPRDTAQALTRGRAALPLVLPGPYRGARRRRGRSDHRRRCPARRRSGARRARRGVLPRVRRLRRRRAAQRAPISSCGCFGKVDTPPSVVHVVLDVAAAAVAARPRCSSARRGAPRRARRPAAARHPVPVAPRDRMFARVPRVHLAPEDAWPRSARSVAAVSRAHRREQGRRAHQLVREQGHRLLEKRSQPPRVPHRFGDGGLRGRGRRVRRRAPSRVAVRPHHRLRAGGALHRRVHRVLLHASTTGSTPARPGASPEVGGAPTTPASAMAAPATTSTACSTAADPTSATDSARAAPSAGARTAATPGRCTATTSATGSATRRSASSGPIACRVVTCAPPYVIDAFALQHRGRGRQPTAEHAARARLRAPAAAAADGGGAARRRRSRRSPLPGGLDRVRSARTPTGAARFTGTRRGTRVGASRRPSATSGIAASENGVRHRTSCVGATTTASGGPRRPNGGPGRLRVARRSRARSDPIALADASGVLRVRARQRRPVLLRTIARAPACGWWVALGGLASRRFRSVAVSDPPGSYVVVRGARPGDLVPPNRGRVRSDRGSRRWAAPRRRTRSASPTRSGPVVFGARRRQLDLPLPDTERRGRPRRWSVVRRRRHVRPGRGGRRPAGRST